MKNNPRYIKYTDKTGLHVLDTKKDVIIAEKIVDEEMADFIIQSLNKETKSDELEEEKYYALTPKGDWEERYGIKVDFWEREMFVTDYRITDGRTGRLVACHIDDVIRVLKDKDNIIKKIADLEKENLSPLYRAYGCEND